MTLSSKKKHPFSFDLVTGNWDKNFKKLLPISANTFLYYLLGNRFGGDGETTFGLPELNEEIMYILTLGQVFLELDEDKK